MRERRGCVMQDSSTIRPELILLQRSFSRGHCLADVALIDTGILGEFHTADVDTTVADLETRFPTTDSSVMSVPATSLSLSDMADPR